jgi:hypothetical protein
MFHVFSGRQISAQKTLFSPFRFGLTYPLSTNGTKANEYTNGASVNLPVSVSRNENNFTLAGFSNVVSGTAKGVQFAGISNHIGKEGKGLAFAGITNITSDYRDVQFAGMVNKTEDVKGVQFGEELDIARKGTAYSSATLINIAEESDFPIGLINLIKNGEKGIAVTYDVLGNTIVSFRSGGKYTYGILGVGCNHKTGENDKMATEAGYGAHIPVCKWFQVNNEIKATTIGSTSDNSSINVGYLLAPSFRIKTHYNLFGGVSLNYFTSKSVDAETLLPGHDLWKKKSNDRLQQIYIGYQVGIQYIF